MRLTFGWILVGLFADPFGGLPDVLSVSNSWLYYGLTLASAVVCLTGTGDRRQRAGWTLVFLGCLAWICGSLYLVHLSHETSRRSLWDHLGLGLFYALAAVGILLLRDRTRTLSRRGWGRWAQAIRLVDGAAVALALNALAAVMIFDHLGESDPRAAFITLAHPVLCSVLLTVLVVILAMRDWAGARHWRWLSAAILICWISDTAFISPVEGSHLAGVVTDYGWLAAFACFGAAAAAQTSESGGDTDPQWRLVLVPSLFALIAFATLVATAFQGLNVVASVLAAGSMFAVLLRQVLTLIDHREVFTAVHQESRTDALTGLANRRALLDDLQRRRSTADEEPYLVALFDLDGFKRFNDVFGHPAGDVLLARLARALQDTAGIERAYRLGGDEYCVIIPAKADDDWRSVLGACAASLQEQGESYRISSSLGFALVPREARTFSEVMQLADRRMYENKAERRLRGKDISLRRPTPGNGQSSDGSEQDPLRQQSGV